MKTFKKAVSCLLAAILVAATCVMGVSAGFGGKDSKEAVNKELRFNADGKFKILQISDIQDDSNLAPIAKDYISDLVDAENPDLIVLTGDNISSGIKTEYAVKKSIDNFMSVLEEKGIPVAAVFGNHDDENTKINKNMQMKIYQSYDCFIGCVGDENISGVGNYNLPILASDSDKTAFNIWCIDSGTYNTENDLGGYNCVRKDQIDWYINTSNALKAANGGVPVPSIAFQHIIVPEIFEALKEVDEGTDGAIKHGDKYYVLPETASSDSVMHESPCPPNYSNGEFDAMLSQGDVLAIAVGHDHINSFVVPYKGIDIISTPGVGFQSYGDETRGARVFVIDENNPTEYETYTHSYAEFYNNDIVAMARYQTYDKDNFICRMVAVVKYVFLSVLRFIKIV
ncbi:MAG: metallophosphoesterase family protein [Clostridia bacterium]|nr:metallophosphoesterase family protein [Clostridia bacterium]